MHAVKIRDNILIRGKKKGEEKASQGSVITYIKRKFCFAKKYTTVWCLCLRFADLLATHSFQCLPIVLRMLMCRSCFFYIFLSIVSVILWRDWISTFFAFSFLPSYICPKKTQSNIKIKRKWIFWINEGNMSVHRLNTV